MEKSKEDQIKDASIKIMSDLSVFSFSKHPAFKIDHVEGLVGYKFGFKSGPAVGDTNVVLHEVAHAIEFGAKNFKKRCKYGGFVFKSPKRQYYRDNRGYLSWYEDWNGSSALEREIRTCAIQYVLLSATPAAMSIDEFIEDQASALKYMPDFGNGKKDADYISAKIKEMVPNISLTACLKDFKKWLDKAIIEIDLQSA